MTEFWFEKPLGRALLQSLPEQKQNVLGRGDVLERIIAAQQGAIGAVTPETCMQSPTVQAIVTAITRRFAVTPIHVYRKTRQGNRDVKELLPNHPVARLLSYPNSFQTRVNYWQDASSWFARYGRYFAYKSRGSTGPIRQLIPMRPDNVAVTQDANTWALTYEWGAGATMQTYGASRVHHVRGPSRDGFTGDSPVKDVAQAIALEIAAEKFGATFFTNGALPLLLFSFMTGSGGFKTKDEEKQFIEDFQGMFSGARAHRAALLPRGMDKPTPVQIENDKSQFLETRKYQRTVIAGAWGCPPHLVGDLERATFNNVEQQDQDFTGNVIMPIGTCAEAAMERDLLTDDDINSGVIIRFNFDSILRADFKSRQEGMKMQRDAGVINANEWREREGMNPIDVEDGGDDYWRPANTEVAGKEPVDPAEPAAPIPAKAPESNPAAKKLDDSLKRLKAIAEDLAA
jgi:HK97 family phage portal protein